jgi:hypothetical protein
MRHSCATLGRRHSALQQVQTQPFHPHIGSVCLAAGSGCSAARWVWTDVNFHQMEQPSAYLHCRILPQCFL